MFIGSREENNYVVPEEMPQCTGQTTFQLPKALWNLTSEWLSPLETCFDIEALNEGCFINCGLLTI